jgi:hypothetical protein
MTDVSNVQQTLVTGKCETCGDEIAPGKDAAAFARNKGLHMRMRHGVVGGWTKLGRKEKRPGPGKRNKVDATAMQPWEIGLAARLTKQLGVKPGLYPLNGLRMAIKKYTNKELAELSPEDRHLREKIRKSSWWNKHYGKNGTTPDSRERRRTKLAPSYYEQHREEILQRQKEARAQRLLTNGVAPSVATQPVQPPVGIQTLAEPCKLSECPICHSRFWVVRGKEERTTE